MGPRKRALYISASEFHPIFLKRLVRWVPAVLVDTPGRSHMADEGIPPA